MQAADAIGSDQGDKTGTAAASSSAALPPWTAVEVPAPGAATASKLRLEAKQLLWASFIQRLLRSFCLLEDLELAFAYFG